MTFSWSSLDNAVSAEFHICDSEDTILIRRACVRGRICAVIDFVERELSTGHRGPGSHIVKIAYGDRTRSIPVHGLVRIDLCGCEDTQKKNEKDVKYVLICGFHPDTP